MNKKTVLALLAFLILGLAWALTKKPAPTLAATDTTTTSNSITNVKADNISLTAGATISIYSQTPTITGTTDSVSTMTITINSTPVIAQVTAEADGDFSYTVPIAKKLSRGTHILNVVSTDQFGNLASFSGLLRVYLPHPDGTLVKTASSATVYLLEGGEKKPITSADAYFSHYDSWDGIITIPTAEAAQYTTGDPLAFRDGSIIKTSASAAVYLIQPGSTRRAFPSADVYLNLGYRWDQIRTASTVELNLYTAGDVINYNPSGTLAKGTSAAIYLIEGTTKRVFPTAETFLGLGYKWSDVQSASDSVLAGYDDGDTVELTHLSGTLVKTASSAAVYLLEQDGDDIVKKAFPAATIYLSHDYNWGQIVTIRAQELAGYTAGDMVAYRDGTLVKGTSAAVYVIEDGKKRVFGSGEVFLEMGYSWGDIMNVENSVLTNLVEAGEDIL